MDGTTYNTSTVCTGDYMQCKVQHGLNSILFHISSVIFRFGGKKDGRNPETLGSCLVIFSCPGGGRQRFGFPWALYSVYIHVVLG
jgi:hypothetical protein